MWRIVNQQTLCPYSCTLCSETPGSPKVMNHLGYLETFAQVNPKKQEYSKETIVPILRIRGAPICQKLGMILENKWFQKLKLQKDAYYKIWSPKLIY